MRKFLLATVLAFSSFCNAHAAKEQAISSLTGNAVRLATSTGVDLSLSDPWLGYMLANNNILLTSYWEGLFRIKTGSNAHTYMRTVLRFDDHSLVAYNIPYWKVQVTYNITLYNPVSNITGSSVTHTGEQLYIDYAPTGVYKDIAQINYHDYLRAEVTITNVDFVDEFNVPIPSSTYVFPPDVYFDLEQSTERYYQMDNTLSPTITTTDGFNASVPVNNELQLSWDYLQGAESYDLEWLFIDDYSISANGMWSSSSHVPAYIDWKNATRVNVVGHNYNVPLGFPSGVILFRIRGVGIDRGNFQTRVEGKWSYDPTPASIDLGSISTIVFKWKGLDKELNWQYSASYAEDGKRKEVIAYFDGALFDRQNVTVLNTQQDAMIAETKYDFNGRGVVNILPTPAASTGIHYYTNFNTGFDANDFDLNANLLAPGTMSTSNGAGQFWSSSNPGQSGTNALIPDAGGYPYARVIYKNDGTNRPSIVSGIGTNHAIGSGHEIEYFYGTPNSQDELDRLFGNEVGPVSHYKKNMVVDANKQISVSYLDQEGRVIASALAGATPTNLLEIDGRPDLFNVVGATLLGNNHLTANGEQISTTTLTVSTTGNYDFDYSLTGATHCDECLETALPESEGCVDCKYDIDIRVLDENNTSLYHYAQSNITAQSTVSFTINFTTIGVYTVIKVLRLNAAAQAVYQQQYMEGQDCLSPDPETVECPTCSTACEENYIRYDSESEIYYVNDEGETVTESEGLELIAACEVLACGGTIPDACPLIWDAMLRDVSPGGQYFDNTPDAYITNVNGIGVPNPMYDINLWLDEVMATFVTPASLDASFTTWDDVRDHWDPAYADILVEHHPERCAFAYFCEGSCGVHGTVTHDMIYQYQVDMQTSTDGGNGGSYYVYLNPLGLSNGSVSNDWDDDQSAYVSANTTNTSTDDPLFRFGGCHHDLYNDVVDALLHFVDLDGTCSATGNAYSIWYLIDDPDGIAWSPPSVGTWPTGLPQEVIDLFQALHGTYSGDPNALIGTGPGQISRYAYFRSVYFFYRELAIAKYFDDFADAQECASGAHPEDVGPQYSNHYLEMPRSTNAGATYPTHGPVDDYGYVIYYPENPVFSQLGYSNSLPLPCAMLTPFTDYVLGPGGNDGLMALQCATTCEQNADEWMSHLNTCLNPIHLAQCRQTLIDICTLYCDGDNPQGSEGDNSGTLYVLAPDMTTQLSSFEEAINYYNSVNTGYPDCPYIHHPDEYDQAICTCTNITDWLDATGYDPTNVPTQTAMMNDFNALFEPAGSYTVSNMTNWLAECDNAHPSLVTLDGIATLEEPIRCSDDEPDPTPEDFSSAVADECDEELQNEANFNAYTLFNQALYGATQNYMSAYFSSCMGNVGSREVFTVGYPLDEYNYTLYYYDQSGNLIKTVPPEGVRTLDYTTYTHADQHGTNTNVNNTISEVQAFRISGTGSFVHPPHHMVTRYVYNSLNNPVEAENPDHGTPGAHDGITTFFYDALGRVVASQDDRQRHYGTPAYGYTLYDDLGRPYESGEFSTSTALTDVIAFNTVSFASWISGGTKKQVSTTFYDELMPSLPSTVAMVLTQEHLRNRVSSVTWDEDPSSGTYDHATHFSYDIHGNVSALVQEIPALDALSQSVKLIEYDYDLVTNNVNAVHYQDGKPDQFHHKYTYDADNRMVAAYSSRDGWIWEKDSKQFYYRYGPMSRMEIGDKTVQGQDCFYTIQGWAKGINSSVLDPDYDAGNDGQMQGQVNDYFAVDGASFILDYFNGDYTPIGGTSPEASPYAVTNAYGAALVGLFNGNISGMQTNVTDWYGSSGTAGLQANAYRYDQLNRIKTANAFRDGTITSQWDNNTADNGMYAETFTYDHNGNILEATRNGNNTGLTQQMDAFTYSYVKDGTGDFVTNKLDHVDDLANSGNYSDDIDDQAAVNYDYDKIGNLVSDVTEDIQTIDWNVKGKIKSITRSSGSGTNKPDIEFGYDNLGNRLYKKVKPRISGMLSNEDQWTYTWYVRDVEGAILATYDQKDSVTGTNAYDRVLKLKERNIYGEKRVGMLDENFNTAFAAFTNSGGNFNADGTYQSASSYTITLTAAPGDYQQRTLGNKRYELSNHLGNVLGVITDRRLSVDGLIDGIVDYYAPEFVISSDYYAFGAPMPGRQYSSSSYRYGFNGKENDPESVSTGEGLQDYGMRIYNPALGKFLSIDPITKQYPELTPYQFASNRPIDGIDLDGLEYHSAPYWAAANLSNTGIKWRYAEPSNMVWDNSLWTKADWKTQQMTIAGTTTCKLFCAESNAVSYYQANPVVAKYLLSQGFPSGWAAQENFFKNSKNANLYSFINPDDAKNALAGDLVFFHPGVWKGNNPHACMLAAPVTYSADGNTMYMSVYSTNAVAGTDLATRYAHDRAGTADPNTNTFGVCYYTLEKTESGLWQLMWKTQTWADGSKAPSLNPRGLDYSQHLLYLDGFGRVEEDKIDPPPTPVNPNPPGACYRNGPPAKRGACYLVD